MLESKEEIFNIFSGLDEKEIFLKFKNLIIGDIKDLGHLNVVLWGGTTSGSQLGESLLLMGEHGLNLKPLFVVDSGLILTDSLGNVIETWVNVGHIEVLSKVFLEVNWVGLANGLSLLDKVILNVLSAVQISFVGLLVHCDLIVSLIVNSFSHVLVLFHSNHFLDVLLNKVEQVNVGLLLDVLIIRVDFSLELVLDVEQLTNVLLTDLLEFLIHVTFNIIVVTDLIGLWKDAGAYLLGQRREGTSGSNGSEELEYISATHFV